MQICRLCSLGTLIVSFLLQSAACSQDTGAPAKAPAVDPYAFSTRVYRLPSVSQIANLVPEDLDRLRAPPALPPASASHGELEAFIKRSHEVIKELMKQAGITLPPGSLAIYDPKSEMLILRAMQVVHSMVEPWAQSLRNQS